MKEIMGNIGFSNWMLILIAISLLMALLCKVRYFNFSEIFKNYFVVFRDTNGKINIFAIYLADVLPLWIALYVKDFLPVEDSEYTTELLIVTILTTLFFSVFGIIFSLKDKLKDLEYVKNRSASEKVILDKLVDSLLYINMFEIVISVFILIFCFVNGIIENGAEIFKILIYYLLFVLLINMFILLRRLNVTLREMMKD